MISSILRFLISTHQSLREISFSSFIKLQDLKLGDFVTNRVEKKGVFVWRLELSSNVVYEDMGKLAVDVVFDSANDTRQQLSKMMRGSLDPASKEALKE
ncbi:hypothetical protein AAC387_Pa10g1369 [Persea americana]